MNPFETINAGMCGSEYYLFIMIFWQWNSILEYGEGEGMMEKASSSENEVTTYEAKRPQYQFYFL
jgi:hypothetical protein